MSVVVLVAEDEPLVEGLAQTLVAAGHQVHLAATAAETLALAEQVRPLVLLVPRELALASPELAGARLAAGGAVLLHHRPDEPSVALAGPVLRRVLADLALPLERQRLLALVRHLERRAASAGRLDREATRIANDGGAR